VNVLNSLLMHIEFSLLQMWIPWYFFWTNCVKINRGNVLLLDHRSWEPNCHQA